MYGAASQLPQAFLGTGYYGPISINLLPSRMAAINAQVATRHKTTGVAEEEDGRSSIFTWQAQSPQHVLLGPYLLALGEIVKERLQHVRHNVPRGQGVDTDAILAPLSRQTAAELDDGRLGCIICSATREH